MGVVTAITTSGFCDDTSMAMIAASSGWPLAFRRMKRTVLPSTKPRLASSASAFLMTASSAGWDISVAMAMVFIGAPPPVLRDRAPRVSARSQANAKKSASAMQAFIVDRPWWSIMKMPRGLLSLDLSLGCHVRRYLGRRFDEAVAAERSERPFIPVVWHQVSRARASACCLV